MKKNPQQSGFALLMTLVVVSVVISIGISILDLSIKQTKLSTNTKDSEIAFHAANAGMECARFWRREAKDKMETGDVFSPVCFGTASVPSNVVPSSLAPVTPGSGDAFFYGFSFSWGSISRCTNVSVVVASSTLSGGGLVVTNIDMKTVIPGYPDNTDFNCAEGARCSVVSVRGYNRACASAVGYGSVEREVLLQF